MRDGAEDFLEKRAPKEQLLGAVQRALARDAQERESRARQRELRARFDTLTKRELEVLGHVVRGRLNKQIAGDLDIHERTVKLHRTAITTKLRVQSVAELTRLTDEAGLFQRPAHLPLRAVVGGPAAIYSFQSPRWHRAPASPLFASTGPPPHPGATPTVQSASRGIRIVRTTAPRRRSRMGDAGTGLTTGPQ